MFCGSIILVAQILAPFIVRMTGDDERTLLLDLGQSEIVIVTIACLGQTIAVAVV